MATSERHLLASFPSLTPSPSPSDPSSPTGAAAQFNFGCFSFTTASHHLQLPARPASASAPDPRIDLSSAHSAAADHAFFEVPLDEGELPETPRFFHPRSSFAGGEPRPSTANAAVDGEAARQARFGDPRSAQIDSKAAQWRLPSRKEVFGGGLSSSRKGSSREDLASTRVVHISDPDRTAFGRPKSDIAGNSVRTSKYTFVTFVPRNLFEQFQRVAYIYFLVIVVLNQIPPLAVFGRTASIFPLAIVLVATAVKDAYEDWARHKSDRVENNRTSLIKQGSLFQSKRWKHIRVGELMKIHANEIVPADMVVLRSSEASGVAYVETMNLDGESNLKTRYAKQETSAWNPEDGPPIGPLICELPNRNIYAFQAYLDVNGVHLPLGPNNIILRGCELKNTSWVVGVVVYAGKQTKAMLNNSGAQHKRSRLERLMNKATGHLALLLLILCAVGGIGMGTWLKENEDYLDELPFYRKKNYDKDEDYDYYGVFGGAAVAFLSCIIVFQVMVPIALYISLELVRLWQAHFMTLDMDMYHGDSDSRFQCRALNINEDLGQVKYVFSDKTGTLTENKMEFHSASVAGTDYSDAQPMEAAAADRIQGVRNEDKRPSKMTKWDARLMEILRQPTDTPERRAAHDYMLVLAACNTIVPTRVYVAPNGQVEMEAAATGDHTGGIEYQGESPDEQALVSAAASYGYELLERSFESIVINVMGTPQRYQILGLHEFDSVRKRMSVVVRCPDETIKVLVKGADSAMLNVIAREEVHESTNVADEKHQHDVKLATMSQLDKYSTDGLRTLVVASREIDSKQYNTWHNQYDQASTAVNDRAELLRSASALVESDLCLLGATAIEDRLQAGVPETIAALREAGIKVWVLTGDKQETAISIGYSCHLLTEDMQQIVISESTVDGTLRSLRTVKQLYKIGNGAVKGDEERDNSSANDEAMGKSRVCSGKFAVGDHPISTSSPFSGYENIRADGGANFVKNRPLALIIDGNTLVEALKPEVNGQLYEVARACEVVICCRVAPFQKAAVVNLIKEKTGELTLAIGDGENDVSMIQMADVGIGVSGQEGRQAVMASDFSMGQFRFLKRLLLVHGHWNYHRLSYMLLYNFYRNSVFVFTLFWFILYSAYSPQSAITDWSLVFFSLIYTSIPTIVVATLDKNLSHRTLGKYPALYGFGQRGDGYNQTLFWMAMIDSVWQSLVLFYVPFLSYRRSDGDLYGIGCIWTFGVVLLVNLHLAMDVYRWTWVTHASIWGSILVTFVFMLVLDSLSFSSTFLINYGSMKHMLGDPKFYIDLLIVLPVALLPRFCAKVVGQYFWPSDVQIAREAEIMGSIGGEDSEEDRALELNNLPRA